MLLWIIAFFPMHLFHSTVLRRQKDEIWVSLVTIDRENFICLNLKIPHLFRGNCTIFQRRVIFVWPRWSASQPHNQQTRSKTDTQPNWIRIINASMALSPNFLDRGCHTELDVNVTRHGLSRYRNETVFATMRYEMKRWSNIMHHFHFSLIFLFP